MVRIPTSRNLVVGENHKTAFSSHSGRSPNVRSWWLWMHRDAILFLFVPTLTFCWRCSICLSWSDLREVLICVPQTQHQSRVVVLEPHRVVASCGEASCLAVVAQWHQVLPSCHMRPQPRTFNICWGLLLLLLTLNLNSSSGYCLQLNRGGSLLFGEDMPSAIENISPQTKTCVKNFRSSQRQITRVRSVLLKFCQLLLMIRCWCSYFKRPTQSHLFTFRITMYHIALCGNTYI